MRKMVMILSYFLLSHFSVIGTCSLRRIAQLIQKFPHLKFENIVSYMMVLIGVIANKDALHKILINDSIDDGDGSDGGVA